jgi:hypothetical protein
MAEQCPKLLSLPLSDIVDRAWRLRETMDLTTIGYGRIHWGNLTDTVTNPFNYYYFLAGLVRLLGVRRIVEVGTHQGGSARAMAAALKGEEQAKIVTFDVTKDGAELLAGHAIIRAYNLDANSEEAYETCLREFGEPKVEFAYIDAIHDFWPTLNSFLICTGALGADIVVLDDITLNNGMKKLWHLIRLRYGDDAIDATEVHPEIRSGGGTLPGFGVVRTCHWRP